MKALSIRWTKKKTPWMSIAIRGGVSRAAKGSRWMEELRAQQKRRLIDVNHAAELIHRCI